MSGNSFFCLNLRELQSFDEAFLGALFRRAFNHHHFLFVADVDEVECGIEHLFVGRIDDEFAVDFAQADTADGPVPRNVRNKQCRRRAVYHQNIGVVDHIRRKKEADDLNFVHKALREERAKGTVAKTRCQNFLFVGAAFAFEVSAGEASRRRICFAVIDGEREEVLPVFERARRGYVDEQVCLAKADYDRAVCLLGDCARRHFNSEVFDLYVVFLFHLSVFLSMCAAERIGRSPTAVSFGKFRLSAKCARRKIPKCFGLPHAKIVSEGQP